MSNLVQHLAVNNQPQTIKDRPDQVQNSQGGYVYELDDMAKLSYFLVLGTEGGTYYAGEKKLTIASAAIVTKLLNDGHGYAVVDKVVEISDAGRAPKNDTALLVIAMCLSCDNTATRSYAADKLPKIARTGTHLFTVVHYVNELRKGWGRSLRRAIANWYNSKDAKNLALQVCKYQSRTQEGSNNTWSHRDVLRLAHVRPVSSAHSSIMKYATEGWSQQQLSAFSESDPKNPFNYIFGHELCKTATTSQQVVDLIHNYRLVRESIPTQFLKDRKVWEALLVEMPYTALIRNLATLTRNGVVGPLSDGTRAVAAKLADGEALRAARVHPITILQAMKQYASGRSLKGDGVWVPDQQIINALDEAYYLAFENVEPTNKRIMLAMDCSGSMTAAVLGFQNLSAREAACAMALQLAKTEPNHYLVGFTSKSVGRWAGFKFMNHPSAVPATEPIQAMAISPRMRMDSALDVVTTFPWGGTDCALPMEHAMQKNLKVDAFVIITDNETFDGRVKADEALRQYRRQSGIKDAKLIVLATSVAGFTIGDPRDKNTLNVAGFDAHVPQILNSFIKGDL